MNLTSSARAAGGPALRVRLTCERYLTDCPRTFPPKDWNFQQTIIVHLRQSVTCLLREQEMDSDLLFDPHRVYPIRGFGPVASAADRRSPMAWHARRRQPHAADRCQRETSARPPRRWSVNCEAIDETFTGRQADRSLVRQDQTVQREDRSVPHFGRTSNLSSLKSASRRARPAKE